MAAGGLQRRMRGLTFELSGRQRQDARARTGKMYRVPQAGRWWPAVGAPLERGVRRQRGLRPRIVPMKLVAVSWHGGVRSRQRP
jgi:hypothetical protein